MSDTLDPRPDRDPFVAFERWLKDARGAGDEADTVTLATSTLDGVPSARMVSMRRWDRRGFVFFSSTRSRKGNELEQNPKAALVFYWPSVSRQIRIDGSVETIDDGESDEYFASRPPESQAAAVVAPQSERLESRDQLIAEHRAQLEQGGPVERPADWVGYRVVPKRIEFWQSSDARLHHRHICEGAPGGQWSWHEAFP
ncbi:MAG: pyridoxamine 5'-phosphate oxidase [Planctomycetota bacterium]